MFTENLCHLTGPLGIQRQIDTKRLKTTALSISKNLLHSVVPTRFGNYLISIENLIGKKTLVNVFLEK